MCATRLLWKWDSSTSGVTSEDPGRLQRLQVQADLNCHVEAQAVTVNEQMRDAMRPRSLRWGWLLSQNVA